MSSKLALMGPAYKHANTAMAHARMKGFGQDIAWAMVAVALADEHKLSPTDAVKMTSRCMALATKLYMDLLLQECIETGQNVEEFHAKAAPGLARANAVLAEPITGPT